MAVPISDGLLLVGTFTERMPHAEGRADGILGYRFVGGALRHGSLLARARNPTSVIAAPDGSSVYAVSETRESEGTPGGSVHAYALDRDDLTLAHLNTALTHAGLPNHLCVDPAGRFLIVTHYSGVVSVFGLERDGSIGEQTDRVEHVGSGSHPRQASAHPHMAAFVPSTNTVIIPDLGLDALIVYSLSDGGKLEERASERVRTDPGSGPRQIVFRPDQSAMLLVTELDNMLISFGRERDRWREQSRVSTLPPGFSGVSEVGGICLSASGEHLFVANRGANLLTTFELNGGAAPPRLVGATPAAGEAPRELTVSVQGSHLLCANQNSDTISVFEIDAASAELRPTGAVAALSPACLSFA